ncbi:MAG: hypothetical protein M5U01_38660 [Ardenticatenaceae bacterium]|nr:hypothetical protein [Ardenticatenaceae bacterium]
MEGFAHAIGLVPQQVWDEADRSEQGLFCGRPTGSAMRLMWAHAEYIKLLSSTADGQVFDFIPALVERHQTRTTDKQLEVWKPNRQAHAVRAGSLLRIQAPAPFYLHRTVNEWQDV